MTDRELIELAAKAAGYIVVGPADEMVVDPEHKSGGLVIKNDHGGDSLWHPLKDDADAFLLAVRLGIFLRKDFIALLSVFLGAGMPHDAATRAAVTEISAKIGMLKQEQTND